MAKSCNNPNCETKEQFKTMIGGQALIEGIMMRGPEKDAIVVRTPEGLKTEISDRKIYPKTSPLSWPFIRGPVNFFDAQFTGIKALMKSADLNPDAAEEAESKFDKWLEKKLKDKKSQDTLLTVVVCISLLFSIGLFFVVPMLLGAVFELWIDNILVLNLIEGLIRVIILVGYMFFSARLKEMKRVFAYHGAEHKTISCYEAGLPLTVENVRTQSRFHPRCGTSFLLVVVVLSILLFSIGLFFVLPMLLGSVFEIWVKNIFTLNLIEGLIRVVILVGYMLLASLPKDMQRVFAYHGAEHKTICCYEAGLPLTVENVRKQCRFHPRCGTSFLLIVVLLSILLFSVVSSGLYGMIPWLNGIRGTIGCKLIMMAVKLLLLPVIVSIAYEINRLVGRYDNWFTKLLTAPGLWMQRITTNEPDDDMIEVGIAAVEAVLPSEKGADQW